MQNGSVIRTEGQRGPDVWEFRWREPSADGKRKHRRMILGSIDSKATSPEQCRSSFAGVQCSCWLSPVGKGPCSFFVPTRTGAVDAKTLATQRNGCGLRTRVVFFCAYKKECAAPK
jgi:hypothetical protein